MYRRREIALLPSMSKISMVTAVESLDAADVKEILCAAHRMEARGLDDPSSEMFGFVRKEWGAGDSSELDVFGAEDRVAVAVTRRYDLLPHADRLV